MKIPSTTFLKPSLKTDSTTQTDNNTEKQAGLIFSEKIMDSTEYWEK